MTLPVPLATNLARLDAQTLKIEVHERVVLITLHRPQALNALNEQLVRELTRVLKACDKDESIGAVVITGSGKAFAAGADIREMAAKGMVACFQEDFIAAWGSVAHMRKPLIAAVNGFALGGGCELAMMCDFIIASDTAQFGQPEINLGVIPGAGGTQRLPRAIGKAKAMDLVLTGRMMDAQEAERCGLVARIVPHDQLIPQALEIAATIAAKSLPATMAAIEAINRAFESSLNEGLLFERRSFHARFGFEDQKEGMQAFLEKRPPQFRHR